MKYPGTESLLWLFHVVIGSILYKRFLKLKPSARSRAAKIANMCFVLEVAGIRNFDQWKKPWYVVAEILKHLWRVINDEKPDSWSHVPAG